MNTLPLLRQTGFSAVRRGWQEIAWAGRLEFVPAWLREPLAYALRCWLATVLAFYAAFFLELDQPYWAGMAVWMVAQPRPGMAISKSVYRIIGTLIGAVMGVVLLALFAQTPELFILALGLWIGGCTLASNLLRNFRAYAAVLAGYTAAIVALGSYANPHTVFDIAVARATATIVGIACATVVTSLFAPHQARDKVRAMLRLAIGETMRRSALPVAASMGERIAIGKPLVDNLIALDAECDFAAAESPEFRIHANGVRSLLAHLFAAISAKRSLEEHLRRSPPLACSETAALLGAAMKLLAGGPARIAEDRWQELEMEMRETREQAAKLTPEKMGLAASEEVSTRIVIDRLDDLLRHLERALEDWQLLIGGYVWRPSLRLDFHRDQRAAMINGARAVLAVGVAGAFWIASAWSSGSLMLIQVGVACSLFSAAERPDKAGTGFFIGGVVGAIAAFLCNFCVLDNFSGFPLLAVAFALFLLPGGMLAYHPKWGPIGTAYSVLFLAAARPLNPMDYDLASFLNNVVALLAGVGCGVMAYRLFMPPDPQAARSYVIYRIRLGLQRISQMNPSPSPCVWQTRMFDRINRLHDRSNPSGWPTDEWFNGGLAALNLGNEILRLRELLDEGKLNERMERTARILLHAFRDISRDPKPARQALALARKTLRSAQPEGDGATRRAWTRARGIVEEMEAFFVEHPRFLTP